MVPERVVRRGMVEHDELAAAADLVADRRTRVQFATRHEPELDEVPHHARNPAILRHPSHRCEPHPGRSAHDIQNRRNSRNTRDSRHSIGKVVPRRLGLRGSVRRHRTHRSIGMAVQGGSPSRPPARGGGRLISNPAGQPGLDTSCRSGVTRPQLRPHRVTGVGQLRALFIELGMPCCGRRPFGGIGRRALVLGQLCRGRRFPQTTSSSERCQMCAYGFTPQISLCHLVGYPCFGVDEWGSRGRDRERGRSGGAQFDESRRPRRWTSHEQNGRGRR